MGNHFIAYIYRLRYIERWSLMRNVVRENVAEHSFHVAVLAHTLGTIARDVYGKPVEPQRFATRALFHDATEVFTGDIPTPVKHHNPDISHNFREIERLAAERLTGLVPDALKGAYAPLLESKSVHDEEYKYVKAADLLDAYLKCTTELSAGNREFAVAKKQIEASMHALDMEEIRYFLEQLAPSMEKPLDELTGP
ncbi:5'-deoxynucleotidase [Paenibacillus alkalitolerans]|uniref:5'-deoxynucleotidase n=1 Tax=Paenibacillus alkalitolerans TaxID=2799335 RepID=UPI0018F4335B|nr:5'-deoxynucleotidase [Paenibacillus alkalitolerans]